MNTLKYRNQFTASLHTHVRSLNDAHIEAKDLAARIKELGGKGVAITDHGVLSSIEDYRAPLADAGLKLIPGCELYVDGGILGRLHLVVLAVNDNGYKGIGKIVTESNRNLDGDFPVITQEKLFEIVSQYKGDIIALSACMQGILSAIFLLNEKVNEKIAKVRVKQAKYLSPDGEEIENARASLAKAESNLAAAIEIRDEVKRISEQKFAKREKAIAKMPADEAEKYRAELEADKKAAEEAKSVLPEVKAKAEKAKKVLSEVKKALKETVDSAAKYTEYERQIAELSKEKQNDSALMSLAREVAEAYRKAFGEDNFYAEVQYHGIEEEKICFPKVAEVARALFIPVVATNDVHILNNTPDERLKRQILRSMRFGKDFEEEHEGDSELYLKNNEELAESLAKILPEDVVDEAISNIDVIFDRCNVEFKSGKHYPKFKKDGDPDALLDEEIKKGIALRFPDGMDEEHKARLAYELPIIKSMGYADYHLVVKDFLEFGRLLGYVPADRLDEAPLSIEELKSWIKEQGFKNPGYMVGPGRGSAVGSLVCYLLGITALDPLDYGLLFERFLNPERQSMPDIDSDFGAAIRPYAIKYVQHKYGQMAVCGIMTTDAQAPKGALRDAAKYCGLKRYKEPMTALGAMLAKDVPGDVGVSFATKVLESGAVDENGTLTLKEYLEKKYASNKDALEIIRWAKILEGTFTAYGAHAAGIVISDNDDISEYLPLKWNKKMNLFTTQCNMVQVEDNGLLKFDFLGLKTLDIITETLRMVEANYGVIIDPLKIDLADKKVYDNILAVGKTNSVFQFESDGMKAMLKRFKPESFEDLIILVSMFRPGPLQYLDGVIDVKNGKAPMTFLVPGLKPILGKTYGAIVYQEQVMEICQKLAGFTLGHADQVRRFMSKKKADKLAHEREAFVDGCKANGIEEDKANTLFDQMMDFARYAFNKSHAAAYAHNAYITAWLKYYYPAEFFASALNWAENKKISGLMYEAKSCGVKVLAPDVNTSAKAFSVMDGKISFGLGYVAGVKDHADDIIAERENGAFMSLSDFCVRVRPNATVIDHLICAGAFDSFSGNRKAMKELALELKDIIPKRDKKLSFIKSAEFVLPMIERFEDEDTLLNAQRDAGLKVEVSKLTTAEKLEKQIETAKDALYSINKEIEGIRLHDVKEDKDERMALEREFLGMYITKHPMDFYPDPKEIGAVKTADIAEGDRCAYGVITNLQIKSRKKDGAKMAFFTLEDTSGSIEVAMFTKAYAGYGKILENGKVIKLFGNCQIKESDSEEAERTFFADSAETVGLKLTTYIMDVTSLATFHLDVEEAFKASYADPKGHPFIIYDKAMDEMREMNYHVSEEVKRLPNVTEM